MTARLRERGLDVTAFDYRPGEQERPGPAPLALYPDIEAFIEPSDPVGLPYEDGAFEAVLSCGVLEHVGDPDASLEELKRVLVPGGTLYVFKLPNRFSYLEAIARGVARAGIAELYFHGAWPNDRIYDLGSAAELLGRHGFAVRDLALANLLPLTVGGGRLGTRAWRVNQRLAQVPGLRGLATNVELVATAPA